GSPWEKEMEASFACPECGTRVELAGLAPGRQVRCPFCHRLLEVPYLPRAGDEQWKRRRFQRPRWIFWAWAGLAIASAVIVAVATFSFLKRHHYWTQKKWIRDLLESSHRHESAGRLTEVLLDFDAALALARKPDGPAMGPVEKYRHRREELAK